MSLYVNDRFVKKLALPDTGAWTGYGTLSETLVLRAGSNDVSIRYDAGDDGNVNLDYLDVKQNEPVQCGRVRARRRVRRRRARPLPLDDDPQRGPVGYAVADGKLQIKAQGGDIVGGTVSAPNVVLQQAPAGGSWAATTKLSIDGTDDYIQAGLVAHASASEWGKLVVMRRPTGEWVIELGAGVGYQNSAALPAGAQKGITLELFASEGRLRGRYSLDDGATWTEVGTGFSLSGLSTPGIGLAAYNGTGAEVGSFEYFTSASRRLDPETCDAGDARGRATRCCSTGPGRAPRTGRWPARGSISRASDCTLFSRGRARPALAHRADRPPVLAQARLEDGRRRQLGRVRRLPRPGHGPGRHASTTATRSRSTPRTTRTDDRRDLQLTGGGRRGARRRAQAAGRVEQLRAGRRGQPDPRLSSTAR